MRTATIERITKETKINLSINLDGTGKSEIKTGSGFFDHMLTLFAKHSRFDLNVTCIGDVEVDYHHTVEDIGIVLGQAFSKALGNKAGINRYGNTILPMDEALILSAVDLSGRSFLCFDLPTRAKRVGNFDVELIEEFFIAFTVNASINLHLTKLAGKNVHHILEGAFKSVARSLKQATQIDASLCGEVPSTKGVL